MTIDQGAAMSRYQGLVPLDGGTLEDAAHEYFLRSEQIPTRVRLAVAEELRAGAGGPSHRWRAGGVLLQFIPPQAVKEDDAWVEGRSLIETVEDIELIDPALSSERLLYRLFHERGVRVFRASELHAQCSCSRNTVEAMLRAFPQRDRDDMIENGVISVTCEFCSETYVFQPGEVADQQGE
jgi:molecular chaperone Hsp33